MTCDSCVSAQHVSRAAAASTVRQCPTRVWPGSESYLVPTWPCTLPGQLCLQCARGLGGAWLSYLLSGARRLELGVP